MRVLQICIYFALLSALTPISWAAARDAAGPVNCAALSERLTHPRWLSLPASRLVINPFRGADYGPAPVTPSGDGALLMDLAYYVGSDAVRLPNFWSWRAEENAARTQGLVEGPRLALSPASAGNWQAQDVVPEFGDGTVTLAATTHDYSSIVRTVTVDLDRTPALLVQVPTGSGGWTIKVNDGSQAVDTALTTTGRYGVQVADVATATGWHGTRTFQVRLFVLGQRKSVTYGRLQFFRLPPQSPLSGANIWMPHEIISQAQIGESTKIEGDVTMPDASSVAQRIHIRPGGPSALTLTGKFPGAAHWDAARSSLLLQGTQFCAAITVSRRARWLGVRPTDLDWALGDPAPAASGVWRLALDNLKPGDDIVISARFSPTTSRPSALVQQASAVASPAAFAAALTRSEAAWNRRLSSVPRPQDFSPRAVPALGTSAADVRRSYYRAWVYFWQDTLPPMPENGFSYPQVCCGKPSLWTDGAPHSEETAVWDGVVAMQALALVDPKGVWSAADGIMSQVDAEGYIGGEMLPPIFAQTFWLLYQQTGDRDKLRASYPALKRFLVWRIAHPFWTYPNKVRADVGFTTQKDNEFVVHALVDMDYAVQIARVLGRPDEVTFWQQQRQNTGADYLHWFWDAPGDTLYRIYYTADDKRLVPNNVWNLKGLYLDPDLLPAAKRERMIALFHENFSLDRPFGITQNRFSDLKFISLGLYRAGRIEDARRMTDLILRDVTRAGEFSETYTSTEPPDPGGVRPSSFGARLMTDSVLWHNGLVLDEGLPTLLGMPGAMGVDNIPVQGDPISVHFNASARTVTLWGPGLRHLYLPAGFRASPSAGAAVWTGPISEGQWLPLKQK